MSYKKAQNDSERVRHDGSIVHVCDDFVESDVRILRGLFFAAGPTAAFWVTLILGIRLLLH
jgi:hypothetical protein